MYWLLRCVQCWLVLVKHRFVFVQFCFCICTILVGVSAVCAVLVGMYVCS